MSVVPPATGDPDAPDPLVPRAALAFLDADRGPTPVLALDLSVVAHRYRRLTETLPGVEVFYAMKANPHPAVLDTLIGLGSGIDVASTNEVDTALAHGADPRRVSYGNTVRRPREITHALAAGVDLFAVDDAAELDKLSEFAPGCRVLVRINAEGHGAAWPLSRKFGTDEATARTLVTRAAERGHRVGTTFHVGSQQSRPEAWDDALATVAHVLGDTHLGATGLDGELPLVNLGGGLPSRLVDPTPEWEDFAAAIDAAVECHLGRGTVRLAIEPGRFLVGDAGVIETEVIGVVERPGQTCTRWAFVDVGLFQGLSEAPGESIRYPLTTTVLGPLVPTVVAGPTCDSTDILYEHRPVELPEGLRSGDRLRLHGTGAYTVSCSTVGFNGFDPLRVEIAPPLADAG